MEGVNPRPSRISAALVSALSASRSSSLSKISNNLKEYTISWLHYTTTGVYLHLPCNNIVI